MKSTKRIRPTKKKNIEVVVESQEVDEDLPFKYVSYPNLYGSFCAFAENEKSQYYLCECSKTSVDNLFELAKKSLIPINDNFKVRYFPSKIHDLIDNYNLTEPIYLNKICHRCNLITPSRRYCHEMYGGNFVQFYGWYINQAELKLGILDLDFIEDVTPVEIIDNINVLKIMHKQRNDLVLSADGFNRDVFEKSRVFDLEISKTEKKIKNYIENIVREDFGFRQIGQGNVSETILANIVREIYEKEEIKLHHRPDWLEGLEIDIYLPNLKLGIEYQGQQHFYPIKAWGGQNALDALRIRDQRKRQICKKLEIKLVEIDYTEPLEKKYVLEKIGS